MGDAAGIIQVIVLLVLVFVFFYFMLYRPQRKRQKEQENLLSSLKAGDQVITVGGILGQIESMDQETVVLKVESGAIRVAKNSIVMKR